MTTLTLQPDAAAGKDTQITSASPTFNNGVNTTLIGSNVTRGLLEFDLSSIPSTAVCDNATLYLYQSNSGVAGAFTITVRSIAAGNTAWVEGTSNNVQALAGHPCWNALAANGSGGVTTAWAGSAGLATATTDYETPNIGVTISGDRSNANGTEYSSVLTPARVQGWFGASNSNHGLILQPSATVGGIASSDNATAAWRPKLVVNYTDGGTPQTITATLHTNSSTLASPAITFGAITVSASKQTNNSTLHAPALTFGAIAISASLFTNAGAFYAPAVAQGAGIMAPLLLVNLSAVYAPQVAAVADQQIEMALLVNSQTFANLTIHIIALVASRSVQVAGEARIHFISHSTRIYSVAADLRLDSVEREG